MSKSELGLIPIFFLLFNLSNSDPKTNWKNKFMKWVRSTSGARYSGVPQNVFIVASLVMPSLHRPKSVILMWPSISSIRFSSCREKCNWKTIRKQRFAISGKKKEHRFHVWGLWHNFQKAIQTIFTKTTYRTLNTENTENL